MVACLLRVSGSELKEYIEDSGKLETRVDSDSIVNDSSFIEVDKSWDGISYLLSGPEIPESEKENDPLSWAMFGNKTLDENQDMGYGPAGYASIEDVKKIFSAMEKLNMEEIRKKFNPQEMMALGVYPEIWSDEEESLEYLMEYYEVVVEFYKSAATEGQAVIAFLS